MSRTFRALISSLMIEIIPGRSFAVSICSGVKSEEPFMMRWSLHDRSLLNTSLCCIDAISPPRDPHTLDSLVRTTTRITTLLVLLVLFSKAKVFEFAICSEQPEFKKSHHRKYQGTVLHMYMMSDYL